MEIAASYGPVLFVLERTSEYVQLLEFSQTAVNDFDKLLLK